MQLTHSCQSQRPCLPTPSFLLPETDPQVTHDRQRGLVVFLRIYSGTLYAKENLHNATRDCKERPLQLLEVRHEGEG